MSGLAGGIVAFVEVTLGWYISWIIGPGRPEDKLTRQQIVCLMWVITLSGSGFGFGGGLVSRLV